MTRVRELDALRGFAVCGIMLVNIWQHAPHTGDGVIGTFFQGRFYPIFSMLFGVSFVLVMRSAGRWVLLRRLFWLACFGLVQHLYYPGEVLTDYALYGAAVLLPASFLPTLAVLPLGLAGVAWATWMGGGSILIPGLFLVGMAVWELRPSLPLAFWLAAPVSAAFTVAWLAPEEHRWVLYTLAALTGAVAYAAGFLLLPRWLTALFEPLGRMALTNYLTGTFVIFLAGPRLDGLSVVAVALVTVLTQGLLSAWWLSRFRYGPFEWAWRCLTWFRRIDLVRDDHRALPDTRLP
ncbi:DUF418 domain-containing protein [Nonomuraea sp. NPDC050556]|uniref:DUF418 domain-containing protein n=1 Tax=Nonomuraea sp. NPDC050556 TaxID=3364369 RepID=UPI0037974685